MIGTLIKFCMFALHCHAYQALYMDCAYDQKQHPDLEGQLLPCAYLAHMGWKAQKSSPSISYHPVILTVLFVSVQVWLQLLPPQ